MRYLYLFLMSLALQLSTLITELVSSGEAELKVQLDDGVTERLLAYSRSVASFPTAVKEVNHSHCTSWHYMTERSPPSSALLVCRHV